MGPPSYKEPDTRDNYPLEESEEEKAARKEVDRSKKLAKDVALVVGLLIVSIMALGVFWTRMTPALALCSVCSIVLLAIGLGLIVIIRN